MPVFADAPDDVPVEALEDAPEEPVAALELPEDALVELADELFESVEDVVAEPDEQDCDDAAESAPSDDDALAAELAAELATAELLEPLPEMKVHAQSPPTSTASRITSAMRHAFFMESIIPKSAMRYAWHGPLRRYRETGKARRIA